MTPFQLVAAGAALVSLSTIGIFSALILQQRRSPAAPSRQDVERIGAILASAETRMSHLEERQDFTDALVDGRNPHSPAPLPASASASGDPASDRDGGGVAP